MNVTEIKPMDILYVQVPIGNLPPSKSIDYLNNVREMIKEAFDNTLIVAPVRGDNYNVLGGIKIEVLRKVP